MNSDYGVGVPGKGCVTGEGVLRACLEEAVGGELRDVEKHDLGLEGGSGGKKKSPFLIWM